MARPAPNYYDQVGLRLPPELRAEIRALAEANGLSWNAQMVLALTAGVKAATP